MREIPILFSAPMVLAILAGKKTVTRRLMNLREFQQSTTPGYDWQFRCNRGLWQDYRNADFLLRVAKWKSGDRLWVRERCYIHDGQVTYYADCIPERVSELKWKPSIHMPRWASRITLEVLSVRAERLQDITQMDVASEGFDVRNVAAGWHQDFAQLWDKLNGAGAWDANPWVWRIEFTRLTEGATR